ncbi:hypothetical protein [Tuwongella immobilis]|uniref:Uncharacterized protein n=1 Tax=Tuwongella immobilis TaxID=692036 RepID=A0A6C2YK78_9BACT|nr:hypothetical protein [Tuwongella immobilis]VIP01774.1 unnamed protein product [Tuwongella immobilis]VTR99409.1 unnamed protein product [Tuwongella immobilis]
MADLAGRIKAFLNRQPPAEVNYVPGSLVEGLMATYAIAGRLDAEGRLLLGICEAELAKLVASKTGPAADYFGECLAIVKAIQEESR